MKFIVQMALVAGALSFAIGDVLDASVVWPEEEIREREVARLVAAKALTPEDAHVVASPESFSDTTNSELADALAEVEGQLATANENIEAFEKRNSELADAVTRLTPKDEAALKALDNPTLAVILSLKFPEHDSRPTVKKDMVAAIVEGKLPTPDPS